MRGIFPAFVLTTVPGASICYLVLILFAFFIGCKREPSGLRGIGFLRYMQDVLPAAVPAPWEH